MSVHVVQNALKRTGSGSGLCTPRLVTAAVTALPDFPAYTLQALTKSLWRLRFRETFGPHQSCGEVCLAFCFFSMIWLGCHKLEQSILVRVQGTSRPVYCWRCQVAADVSQPTKGNLLVTMPQIFWHHGNRILMPVVGQLDCVPSRPSHA